MRAHFKIEELEKLSAKDTAMFKALDNLVSQSYPWVEQWDSVVRCGHCGAREDFGHRSDCPWAVAKKLVEEIRGK